MKKIAAVFLAMTIITLFAACKKEEKPADETTTLATTTSATTTEATTTAPEVDEMTYILTTNADKTVPWENTTRFETSAVSTTVQEETTSEQFSDIDLTTGIIDVPVVSTDTVTTEKITNEPPTAPEGFTNISSEKQDETTEETEKDKTEKEESEEETTEKETTKKPKETTTKPTTTAPIKKVAKGIAIDSVSENGDGDVVLAVSAEGWSSDFKGTTTDVTVVVDGQTLNVPCKISSTKNVDGAYDVVIDLSDLGLSSGTTVNYTIGEGAIQTKAGTQYNSAYSGSYSLN